MVNMAVSSTVAAGSSPASAPMYRQFELHKKTTSEVLSRV